MSETSRSINHKLNELLAKSPSTPTSPNSVKKLDSSTSQTYATILRSNILGKDKQEKVNSIVVLAKLLDCIISNNITYNDFISLDHSLFSTLFSIISSNMSSETYKAILKISVIVMSGTIFKLDQLSNYLPLLDSLVDYLDVLDILTTKLYLQDNKITYHSIKLITDILNQSLKFNYPGLITLIGRLKHVTFFSSVGNSIETDDKLINESINKLKLTYFNVNSYLNSTKFDLTIKSHQILLNNLFIYLEVSLNEYGTAATVEEYIKSGFTDNPRNFVIENFNLLLAMNLKVFLKDPNFTFKKRFHEELMLSEHSRTFPLYLFINKCTRMWLSILYDKRDEYPMISNSILSWELMIYYTMNNCLVLWQETKAELSEADVDKILQLLKSNVQSIEQELTNHYKTFEDCLDITAHKSSQEMRSYQSNSIIEAHRAKWASQFEAFNDNLKQEVIDFVSEQRAIQLLKGLWVYSESHGESLLRDNALYNNNHHAHRKTITSSNSSAKFYFIILSPNRQSIYYKAFAEKLSHNPTYEEMESQAIRISDISSFESTKVGEHIGESDRRINDKLISIKGTISYERITIYGAHKKRLLSFYTDTEVNKYVWLDGLKLQKGLFNEVSDDTRLQIQGLLDIRRNTQLLSLEGISAKEEEIDTDYYNNDELLDIQQDFYYT
ncbi:Lmo1 h [Scheffersomyces amazonensis]|uniref:Lmo1 h n=1 Tax=Scheffersomyces amazonensis TaxID=1078765 RepID=UPI00315CAB49